jgi:hypothetical protein
LDPSEIIRTACDAVGDGRTNDARALIARDYPHVPVLAAGRRYSKRQCVAVFVRDGYVDRYSGQRLVFPGTLRLLSLMLPDVLPFHRNWKMDACHPMFWELYPTIDHIVPVARGGEDAEPNWVCTSMIRNSAKANWTLAELSWALQPPGSPNDWDGLTRWCLTEAPKHPDLTTSDAGLRQWVTAAQATVT